MNENQRQQWITPELVEYGDVAKLTEAQVKTLGSGDEYASQVLSDWLSGTVN